MHKLILCLFTLSLNCLVFAQTKFGVFAGPQATSANYKIEDEEQEVERQYGFHGGINLKIPFEGNLYFTPSLFYSLKGYKVSLNKPSFPPSSLAINNQTRIHVIEIAPLFNIDLSKKESHLFVRFGPSIDVVISGKEKFTEVDGNVVEQPMKFSFTNYGRITAAGNIQLGFEAANGFFISTNYSHGIGSMNNADNGPNILHRVFGLSIGKYFGRNPNVIDTRVMDK